MKVHIDEFQTIGQDGSTYFAGTQTKLQAFIQGAGAEHQAESCDLDRTDKEDGKGRRDYRLLSEF